LRWGSEGELVGFGEFKIYEMKQNFFKNFKIWGENNPKIEEDINPSLEWRSWDNLNKNEKDKIFRIFQKNGWFSDDHNILSVIRYFDREYPNLNLTENYFLETTDYMLSRAAFKDFANIFFNEKENIVLRAISLFAKSLVYKLDLESAKSNKEVDKVFSRFDSFCNRFQYISEKFSLNISLTRNGFVPRQDEKIQKEIYDPVMKILSSPLWKPINTELEKAFVSFQNKDYAKSISESHNVVQGFLQILLHGEHGKNSSGEMGRLFAEAKKKDFFTENFDFFKNFFSAFRANKSTSKPRKSISSSEDALLMLNTVMIFLQHGINQKNSKK